MNPLADSSLRPRTFDEYIGQTEVKKQLKVFISAAVSQRRPLDHMLLYGPPGLGKTTLAYVVANEMGVPIKTISGPSIERQGDLAAVLTNLEPFSVLFIDEIHRIPKPVEEILYSAMEDFRLDILIGKGPAARSVRINLAPFTLIGATTRLGLLTGALRGRFGIVFRLDFYSPEELAKIVRKNAEILGIQIEDGAAEEIARRSRGTPRNANALLKRVKDFAVVKGLSVITYELAKRSLDELGIDELGLTREDRNFLRVIIERFGGGPVGLETLSAALNESADTIEEVYEPYLLRVGLIKRTPRGRVATEKAYRHLKVPVEGMLFAG